MELRLSVISILPTKYSTKILSQNGHLFIQYPLMIDDWLNHQLNSCHLIINNTIFAAIFRQALK
ncbi:MAG: hypothetical protein ACI94Y_000072 [Maribacter sp.]|jgi:hypothetical protein